MAATRVERASRMDGGFTTAGSAPATHSATLPSMS